VGIPTAVKTTQLLYGSTSQTGKPTVNVTSVIQPSRAAELFVDSTRQLAGPDSASVAR
jgi:hypothetical protein